MVFSDSVDNDNNYNDDKSYKIIDDNNVGDNDINNNNSFRKYSPSHPEPPFYFFSFWGVHQNFEVITGLNYRFTGNLHVHVFSTYETGIMTTSKDFTTCHIGTGR